MSISPVTISLLLRFLPFWIFIVLDHATLTLHYSVLAPLGEKILPLALVGLLVGGESFFQMLLDVPAGFLADRFGRRRMLFIGIVAIIIAGALFMRFSLFNFIASIAFSVIGWLFLSPAVNAYLLSYAERPSSGHLLALRDSSNSMGVVIASISLPFILLCTPFVMGITIIALATAALVFLMFSPPDKPVVHGTHTLPAEPYHVRRTNIRKTFRAFMRLNPASGILSLYSFAGAIFYGVIWFVVPLAIANDPHQQLLGVGLGIFDLSVVVLGVLIGSLVDRDNKRLLVFYGLLVFAIMGIVLGATLGPLFLLFGFLATAGDETAGLSLWAWLHSLDKEHAHDGAVAGAISFSEDLGYAIGPAVAGLVYALLGPAWTLTVGALPLVLVWIIYTVIIHPKHAATPILPAEMVPRMPRRKRHKA